MSGHPTLRHDGKVIHLQFGATLANVRVTRPNCILSRCVGVDEFEEFSDDLYVLQNTEYMVVFPPPPFVNQGKHSFLARSEMIRM